MNSPADEELLKSGINALRAGNKYTARELLSQVLATNKKNEEAWYLLSEAVDDIEDCRICLKNVLVLNPKNEDARKRLMAVEASSERDRQKLANLAINQDIVPLSPAAAILYPERLERSWVWQDDLDLDQVAEVATSTQSQYSDVWEEESNICAYCASRLIESRKRCPNCKRKTTIIQFTYPKTSNNFIIYWVLVLAVAQLFFIQILLDLIIGAPAITFFWHGLFLVTFAGLTLLLVLRHPAGYVGSILLLIIVLTWMIIELVLIIDIEPAVGLLAGDDYLLQLAGSPYNTLISPLLESIRSFQMVAIILALIFGIFFVGTDFEKSRLLVIARLDKGIREGTEFYTAGKQYSEKGMWACAVLHYQRAIAREPNRAFYQMSLGKAYARLDFYERALDVLESAYRLSANPELTTEIAAEIMDIRNLQNI